MNIKNKFDSSLFLTQTNMLHSQILNQNSIQNMNTNNKGRNYKRLSYLSNTSAAKTDFIANVNKGFFKYLQTEKDRFGDFQKLEDEFRVQILEKHERYNNNKVIIKLKKNDYKITVRTIQSLLITFFSFGTGGILKYYEKKTDDLKQKIEKLESEFNSYKSVYRREYKLNYLLDKNQKEQIFISEMNDKQNEQYKMYESYANKNLEQQKSLLNTVKKLYIMNAENLGKEEFKKIDKINKLNLRIINIKKGLSEMSKNLDHINLQKEIVHKEIEDKKKINCKITNFIKFNRKFLNKDNMMMNRIYYGAGVEKCKTENDINGLINYIVKHIDKKHELNSCIKIESNNIDMLGKQILEINKEKNNVLEHNDKSVIIDQDGEYFNSIKKTINKLRSDNECTENYLFNKKLIILKIFNKIINYLNTISEMTGYNDNEIENPFLTHQSTDNLQQNVTSKNNLPNKTISQNESRNLSKKLSKNVSKFCENDNNRTEYLTLNSIINNKNYERHFRKFIIVNQKVKNSNSNNNSVINNNSKINNNSIINSNSKINNNNSIYNNIYNNNNYNNRNSNYNKYNNSNFSTINNNGNSNDTILLNLDYLNNEGTFFENDKNFYIFYFKIFQKFNMNLTYFIGKILNRVLRQSSKYHEKDVPFIIEINTHRIYKKYYKLIENTRTVNAHHKLEEKIKSLKYKKNLDKENENLKFLEMHGGIDTQIDLNNDSLIFSYLNFVKKQSDNVNFKDINYSIDNTSLPLNKNLTTTNLEYNDSISIRYGSSAVKTESNYNKNTNDLYNSFNKTCNNLSSINSYNAKDIIKFNSDKNSTKYTLIKCNKKNRPNNNSNFSTSISLKNRALNLNLLCKNEIDDPSDEDDQFNYNSAKRKKKILSKNLGTLSKMEPEVAKIYNRANELRRLEVEIFGKKTKDLTMNSNLKSLYYTYKSKRINDMIINKLNYKKNHSTDITNNNPIKMEIDYQISQIFKPRLSVNNLPDICTKILPENIRTEAHNHTFKQRTKSFETSLVTMSNFRKK